jgi:DMSO/TMAO reductase YedYZ molybdopterin-dependent catalytic subunit
MIIREREPLNLEFPFDQLDGFITPTDLFYVRSHFPAPDLNPASYELRVEGAVERPFSLSLDELHALPNETTTATLECAGNGRVFLVPQEQGAQWELGAVGNAEWTGVRVSTLLERAGLKSNVCEIVLEGADCGEPKEKPKPPQPISFSRSIPVRKALQPEVLVAYRMNGQKIPRDHGFPVRAVVPGYYGMASVKWLTRIEAVDTLFSGYWQTSEYAYWDHLNGNPVRRPLSEIMLKSAIARPRMYEVVPKSRPYSIFGAAWCGNGNVEAVEVSKDSGETWLAAELIDPAQPFAWRRWRFQWDTPSQPGRYALLARAWDEKGNTQAVEHNQNHGSYVIQHSVPIHVFIE